MQVVDIVDAPLSGEKQRELDATTNSCFLHNSADPSFCAVVGCHNKDCWEAGVVPLETPVDAVVIVGGKLLEIVPHVEGASIVFEEEAVEPASMVVEAIPVGPKVVTAAKRTMLLPT